MWWDGDNTWYSGKVTAIFREVGRQFDEYKIHYDDNEKKCHFLADPDEQWEILSAPAPAPKRQKLSLKGGSKR